jgi:hypothetical protein
MQRDIVAFAINYTQQTDFSFSAETPNRYTINVGKVNAVSNVVYAVKAGRMRFPRCSACEEYLIEVASERCIPQVDGRGFRYEKSAGRPDDALHSLTHAFCAANYLRHKRPFV